MRSGSVSEQMRKVHRAGYSTGYKLGREDVLQAIASIQAKEQLEPRELLARLVGADEADVDSES